MSILGTCNNLTHQKYKGEKISLETFEYKGCWNCHYFERDANFPYYDVKEAPKILGKSKSTIIRWIKNNKLDGNLFIRIESKFQSGAPKKYFITKESVHSIIEMRKIINKGND